MILIDHIARALRAEAMGAHIDAWDTISENCRNYWRRLARASMAAFISYRPVAPRTPDDELRAIIADRSAFTFAHRAQAFTDGLSAHLAAIDAEHDPMAGIRAIDAHITAPMFSAFEGLANDCTQPKAHTGACNGWPRLECAISEVGPVGMGGGIAGALGSAVDDLRAFGVAVTHGDKHIPATDLYLPGEHPGAKVATP